MWHCECLEKKKPMEPADDGDAETPNPNNHRGTDGSVNGLTDGKSDGSLGGDAEGRIVDGEKDEAVDGFYDAEGRESMGKG